MSEVNDLAESDSVAILRNGNAISCLPVYLTEANEPFVKVNGAWLSVNGLQGFQRFEKVRRKKLYNTATGKMVQV